MVYAPLIGPVVGLALWTFTMEAWLYTYRIPDLTTYKVNVTPEMSKASMNSKIPRHRQWPADNYDHLHEQPTVFYAITLALQYMGADDSLTVGLAWTYVGIRVLHSLVQAITNVIMVRFQIFALSSLVLLGLTLRATSIVFSS